MLDPSLIEIVNERGWNSKKFHTGRYALKDNGEIDFARPIYAAYIANGLHDENADGSFSEVNTTLEEWESGVHSHRARRTRCGRVAMSDYTSPNRQLAEVVHKTGNGISVKIVSGADPVYGPFNDAVNKTRYNYDAAGVKVEQTVRYNGVSIVLVIQNPQTAPSSYRMSIRGKGCDYTAEKVGGDIICRSSTGADDVTIGCYPAEDASGSTGDVTLDIVGIEPNGDIIIEKAVDEVWLRQAVGPVRLDPTVTISGASDIDDARIYSNQPTFNFGGSQGKSLRGLSYPSRYLIGVNLSAYPTATVVSAKFSSYSFGSTVYPYGPCQYYKVLTTWGEGVHDTVAATSGECAWNYKEYPTTWNTAGCNGIGTDRESATLGTDITIAGIGWVDFPLDITKVQSEMGGYFSMLVATTKSGIDQVNFYATEKGSDIPYFYMEYTTAEALFPSIPLPSPQGIPTTYPGSKPGTSASGEWVTT